VTSYNNPYFADSYKPDIDPIRSKIHRPSSPAFLWILHFVAIKHYSPTGRRNHDRPWKRLLDTWDRNGSTSGPTAWQIYDDNDDYVDVKLSLCKLQGESLARGHKLLSIKKTIIEIMTWKFIYTYRKRCKTGPAHNRCWNWSPFTCKHTGMRFSKFWNTFPKVSTLTSWISWRIAPLSCSIVRGVFLYTLPFNRPTKKEVGRR